MYFTPILLFCNGIPASTIHSVHGNRFDYPSVEIETEIVAHEGGVDAKTAEKLVQVAQRSRNLKGHGLDMRDTLDAAVNTYF